MGRSEEKLRERSSWKARKRSVERDTTRAHTEGGRADITALRSAPESIGGALAADAEAAAAHLAAYGSGGG